MKRTLSILAFVFVLFGTQMTSAADICIQVIQNAKNVQTNECKAFPTPCDVPTGWTNVSSCSASGSTDDSQLTDKDTQTAVTKDADEFKLKSFSSCQDLEKVL